MPTVAAGLEMKVRAWRASLLTNSVLLFLSTFTRCMSLLPFMRAHNKQLNILYGVITWDVFSFTFSTQSVSKSVNRCVGLRPIPGFLERDGKPYCTKDFYLLFAPKCSGCGESVKENYLTAANGTWHPECFVCAVSPLPQTTHMALAQTQARE